MGKNRNFVLITIDSLRADHCSFLGYSRKTTPTIDKMAEKGVCFTNAVSPSYATLPSMKAIFTGNFFIQSSFEVQEMRKQALREFATQTTIAEAFRQLGYSTIGFSLNPWTSSFFGFNKGFEFFKDSFHKKDILSKLYSKLFKKLDKYNLDVLRDFKNLLLKDETFSSWESYYEDIVGHVRKVKEPFFLWIFLLDTHLPYYSPKRYWSSFVEMNVLSYIYAWKLKKHKFLLELPEKAKKVLTNIYDDSIRYVDMFIEKLWNDLEAYDPIFMIHADHGDGFGEHGFYGHDLPYLYEENIHVPWIIYNSGIKEKVQKPVSLLNLKSLSLELAKSSVENFYKFISCKDIVVSKAFDKDGRLRIALKIGKWKFILGQKKTHELYDLTRDPKEQENLINSFPKIVETLESLAMKIIRHDLEIIRIRGKISILRE